MKIFISVLVLIFGFQSWTIADDIKDFQIEGISVGESLLTYISQNKIEDLQKYFTYPNRDHYQIAINDDIYKLNNYDFLQIDLKTNDNNYTIPLLGGVIDFPKKINECILKKNEIITDIMGSFPNLERNDRNVSHPSDKSGNSKVYQTFFRLTNGAISIECEDWSSKSEKELNYTDRLKIYVLTEKYNNWLNYEAYK